MKKDETYSVTVECNNCFHENTVEIKKGVSIKTFFEKAKKICSKCGCAIRKISNQTWD